MQIIYELFSIFHVSFHHSPPDLRLSGRRLLGQVQSLPKVRVWGFLTLKDESVLLCLFPLCLVEVQGHEGGDYDAVADEETRLRANEGKRNPVVFYIF